MSIYDDFYKELKFQKIEAEIKENNKIEKNKKALEQAPLCIGDIVNALYNKLLLEINLMPMRKVSDCYIKVSSNYLNETYFHFRDNIMNNTIETMSSLKDEIIKRLINRIDIAMDNPEIQYELKIKWGSVTSDYSNINNNEHDLYTIEYEVFFKFII